MWASGADVEVMLLWRDFKVEEVEVCTKVIQPRILSAIR